MTQLDCKFKGERPQNCLDLPQAQGVERKDGRHSHKQHTGGSCREMRSWSLHLCLKRLFRWRIVGQRPKLVIEKKMKLLKEEEIVLVVASTRVDLVKELVDMSSISELLPVNVIENEDFETAVAITLSEKVDLLTFDAVGTGALLAEGDTSTGEKESPITDLPIATLNRNSTITHALLEKKNLPVNMEEEEQC